MLVDRSPVSGQQLPKSSRKPLQPKNPSATPITATSPKPKAHRAEWIAISPVIDYDSNKENLPPPSPLSSCTPVSIKKESFLPLRSPISSCTPVSVKKESFLPPPSPISYCTPASVNKEAFVPPSSAPVSVKTESFLIESFDVSLAEELTAIREKLERLKIDKENTETLLRERALKLDLQMKEILNRGEVQKQLEIEVDRLYRLNEIKLYCTRISPLRSLRDKEQERKMKQDQMKANNKSEDKAEESKGESASQNNI